MTLSSETSQVKEDATTSGRSERFLTICKLYLRKTFNENETTLRSWHDENLTGLAESSFDQFAGELERSVKGTPAGRQRRAAGMENENITKLMLFLENVLRKHSS